METAAANAARHTYFFFVEPVMISMVGRASPDRCVPGIETIATNQIWCRPASPELKTLEIFGVAPCDFTTDAGGTSGVHGFVKIHFGAELIDYCF